ncbi:MULTISPECIES: hypothetical protein [Streptomyces]
MSTSVHWGTAQLGAPPSYQPAPRPQARDHDTEDVPAEPAAHVVDEPPHEHPHGAPETGQDPPAQPAPGPDEDAVQELIRVAVVSRPLDDVVDLVTLLEQSPDGVTTAASVLRLAAVARSVDDVTRLVELLGPPKHPAEHMDEAIRHAAEERPVPEVSRLVHLLSRPPHDRHSSSEAVHAAGTTRSVEDLMQLIGSLREQQEADHLAAKSPSAPLASSEADVSPSPGEDDEAARERKAARDPQAARGTKAPRTAEAARDAEAVEAQNKAPLVWLRRAAGILLLLCAAAHFPVNWSDASALGLSAALSVSVICALAGAALFLSGSPVVAVVGTVVAGGLTVAHLVDDRINSTTLGYVLRPEGVSAPLPTLSAVIAALASLLVVAFTVAGLRAAANRKATPRF